MLSPDAVLVNLTGLQWIGPRCAGSQHPDRQTLEASGALQRAEIAKWWPIFKTAGIKPE
jgi:hypothetical protein